jgi:hypothetical protein
MKVLPGIYQWRVKSRIFRWYGELKHLEARIAEGGNPAPVASEYLKRLDEIERGVDRTRVPTGFADYLYNLRSHIQLVRSRIQQLGRESPGEPRQTPPDASSEAAV